MVLPSMLTRGRHGSDITVSSVHSACKQRRQQQQQQQLLESVCAIAYLGA